MRWKKRVLTTVILFIETTQTSGTTDRRVESKQNTFMGQKQGRHESKATSTMAETTSTCNNDMAQSSSNDVYELKKRRPGCTGMFWRSDPRPDQPKLANNNDWPRDGALLKGTVIQDAQGNKWLLATHVQQKGDKWKPAPVGAAMPFEYDNHYYLDSV